MTPMGEDEKMERVSFRAPHGVLEAAEREAKRKDFANLSEFIRYALRAAIPEKSIERATDVDRRWE